MFIITRPGKTVTFGLDTKRLVVSWCQRRKCSVSRKMNLKLLLIFEFLLILVFVAKVQLKQRKSMFSAQTLPGPLTNFGIRNTAESFAFIIDQSAFMHYSNSDLKSHKLGQIFDKIKQACNLRRIFQATFHVNGCLGWF